MMRVLLRLLAALLGCAAARAQDAAPAVYEVFYHHTLRNKTAAAITDVRVYLAVPESGEYQQVRDLRVETLGRPWQVSNRHDAYGTAIRRVVITRLEPGEEVDVGYSCVVTLTPPVRITLDPAKGGSLDDVPKDVREKHTVDHRIFGLATPVVKDAAARLLREHPSPVERAKAIHDLVAGTFKYDGSGGWDAAPDVLARKSGSCSEFTYVFCALCRATGIPTRFVGASILPARSKMPFTDHAHHRWAEAYLPGLGWVPFDPTLDRGRPAKQDFVGTHHGRTLIVSRIGSKSQQLGLAYVGSNSHTGETSRKQYFLWTEGTAAKLAAARKLLDEGKAVEGRAALRELIKKFPGSRAAVDAAAILEPKPVPVAVPPSERDAGDE